MIKLVFMGTPDFAVPALSALYDAGCDIRLVVTKPDREKDRGRKLQSCEVKQLAQKLGLEVVSPEKIKNNPDFTDLLKKADPDVIVVAAYGKILPKEILEIPRFGCINIHGSLLPKYRGAAPIQRAVLCGEQETGVTLMYMSEGCDEGNIIASAKTDVGRKTSAQLFDELSAMGAELLVSELDNIVSGTCSSIPQDDSKACFAPMISKEEAHIDFNMTARQIDCLVRGMYSWPCAYTVLNGANMKIIEACEGGESSTLAPGTVIRADKDGILAACGGTQTIRFTKIQMPGKKAMDVSAFLLGNKIEIGTVLL